MRYNKYGFTIGTPFWQWVNKEDMTEDEITTARVFLLIGIVCGIIFTIGISWLAFLIWLLI